MAANPKRRRQQITLKHEPRVPDAVWNQMTDTEKIIACLGGNLDNIRTIVDVPDDQADLHTRVLQVRIFDIGIKAGLKLHSDREQSQAQSQLVKALISQLGGTRAHAQESAKNPSEKVGESMGQGQTTKKSSSNRKRLSGEQGG